jgi:hypothetical protein
MFIIAYRNDWGIIETVEACKDVVAEFTCESSAIDFAKEKGLEKFEIIEVTV